jgi:hypothetical protein
MQIFINHTLKKALISYPKVAGSTLSTYLTWSEPHWQLHPNIKGWKRVATPVLPEHIDFKNYRNIIPVDYEVFILYRNPLLRYISGFVYVIQEEDDLLFWDMMSSADKQKYFADKPVSWYEEYVEKILKISYGSASLNNIHTTRYMLAVWLLAIELKAKFLYIDDLDGWILNVHNIREPLEIPKINSNVFGYTTRVEEIESRTMVAKTVGEKFSVALHNISKYTPDKHRDDLEFSCRISEYLKNDIYLFNLIKPSHGIISEDLKISSVTHTIESMFGEISADRYSSVTDDLCNTNSYFHSDYIRLVMNWYYNGSNVPDVIKQLINTSLEEIRQRRLSIYNKL